MINHAKLSIPFGFMIQVLIHNIKVIKYIHSSQYIYLGYVLKILGQRYLELKKCFEDLINDFNRANKYQDFKSIKCYLREKYGFKS